MKWWIKKLPNKRIQFPNEEIKTIKKKLQIEYDKSFICFLRNTINFLFFGFFRHRLRKILYII